MIFRIIIILAWQHHYLLLCWWLVISGPDTELGRRWILNRRQMAWPYTLLYRIVSCSLGMKCVPEIRDRSGCSIYHIQHYSLLRQKHVCTYLSPNYSLKSACTGQRPIGWLKHLWGNNWDWDTCVFGKARSNARCSMYVSTCSVVKIREMVWTIPTSFFSIFKKLSTLAKSAKNKENLVQLSENSFFFSLMRVPERQRILPVLSLMQPREALIKDCIITIWAVYHIT